MRIEEGCGDLTTVEPKVETKNRRDWGWECVNLDRVGGLDRVEVDGLV